MLLSSTATTGHMLDGSPMSSLLRNCRTARSHSPARRARRTSRTQRTHRARRVPFAQADRQHQCIRNCGPSRAIGPASLRPRHDRSPFLVPQSLSPLSLAAQDHRSQGPHYIPSSALPRRRADKGSLTRSTLDDCIGVMSDWEQPADLRPDLRVRRRFSHRQQRQAICWTEARRRTCSGTAGQSGVTLLRAGHIGQAERREHAGHAGFPLPRLAHGISTSRAAALPVQPAGFTVTPTRPQPVSRAAVPLISFACNTGPPESGTTLHSLERSLPRGRTDKGSLTRSTLDDRTRVMSD